MVERILVCSCLAACGSGGLLLMLARPPEPCRRMTAWGIIRRQAGRLGAWAASRPRMAAILEEKSHQLQRRQIDQEIYDSSMLLKNLAIVEKQQAFSADYLYEQLMENSVRLRPAFAQLLTLYRAGRDQEAFEVFRQRLGTRAGRNFSLILEKAEQINPEELVEQMEVFQEMMRQQKMTDDMKLVQQQSLITTAAATAVVFVMVIDFAVVVVFLHTVALLGSVF